MYFSLVFKTTATRNADEAVFALQLEEKKLVLTEPYMFPCTINSDITKTMLANYKDINNIRFIVNPVVWNTNTEFRISGVSLAAIQA